LEKRIWKNGNVSLEVPNFEEQILKVRILFEVHSKCPIWNGPSGPPYEQVDCVCIVCFVAIDRDWLRIFLGMACIPPNI